jgi:large subunit ribosomal protein L17
MRHRVAGKKLGRTTAHRLALLRNLSLALFDKEKIRTTLAKAKEVRPFAEKLLTLSKRETLHARRLVSRSIHDRGVVAKLLDTLSARYAQRNGGYTRILKLGPRRGDGAEMAILELVDSETAAPAAAETPKKGRRAKAQPAGEGKSAAEAGKAPRRKKAAAKGAKPSARKAAERKAEAPSKSKRKKTTTEGRTSKGKSKASD